LKWLESKNKLQRIYTQNIDRLESHPSVGIQNSLIVHLHGQLNSLVCNLCKGLIDWGSDIGNLLLKGESPPCQICLEKKNERELKGKRALPTGLLRPNIVLYNEAHPKGDEIAVSLRKDLLKHPQMLLIIGTSLKVSGLKRLVKDLAREIHASNGLVVFIDLKEARKEWHSVIDFQLIGDCDDWTRRLSGVSEELSRLSRVDTYFRKTKTAIVDKPKKSIPLQDSDKDKQEQENKSPLKMDVNVFYKMKRQSNRKCVSEIPLQSVPKLKKEVTNVEIE
jgi:NAD-dependent histone deacetylase SIR2